MATRYAPTRRESERLSAAMGAATDKVRTWAALGLGFGLGATVAARSRGVRVGLPSGIAGSFFLGASGTYLACRSALPAFAGAALALDSPMGAEARFWSGGPAGGVRVSVPADQQERFQSVPRVGPAAARQQRAEERRLSASGDAVALATFRAWRERVARESARLEEEHARRAGAVPGGSGAEGAGLGGEGGAGWWGGDDGGAAVGAGGGGGAPVPGPAGARGGGGGEARGGEGEWAPFGGELFGGEGPRGEEEGPGQRGEEPRSQRRRRMRRRSAAAGEGEGQDDAWRPQGR